MQDHWHGLICWAYCYEQQSWLIAESAAKLPGRSPQLSYLPAVGTWEGTELLCVCFLGCKMRIVIVNILIELL